MKIENVQIIIIYYHIKCSSVFFSLLYLLVYTSCTIKYPYTLKSEEVYSSRLHQFKTKIKIRIITVLALCLSDAFYEKFFVVLYFLLDRNRCRDHLD